jgi:hypothetical protein
MTTPFDASLIHNEPLSEETLSRHRREAESAMRMPSALANAKLHAENDLRRFVAACNRLVWREVPAEMRAPTPEETAWLLEQLRPDDRDRLIRDARAAAEARHLFSLLVEAERHAFVRQQTQALEEARLEAERREWEEFEAFDAADKPKRFAAWRAARRR